MILPFTNKKLVFKAGLLLTLIFVSMAGVFFSLGVWQLQRAEEKKHMAAQIEQRQSLSIWAIENADVGRLQQPDLAYRTIKITGQFETGEQFFVDNKKHKGRAGYHVITPFKIHASEQRILVNRGWVDSGGNRQIMPVIDSPGETVSLNGQLRQPDQAKYRPGISQPADTLGGLWLYIDVKFFNALSAAPVLPYIFLLNQDSPYGFIRDWPKFKANTEMHFGYALQWFAFSFFSLLAYVAIGIKKHE